MPRLSRYRKRNPPSCWGVAFHGAAQTLVERNELEARIQHILRLETLGTMAGGIAHDVNNQLAAISGQIELGLMKAPEESPWRDTRRGE